MGPEEPRTLDEALDRAADAARSAWPDFAVDRAAFVAHLRKHLPAGDDEARAALGSWHVADLYLAFACASSLPGAATTLERMLAQKAPGFLARIGGSGPAFIDEVRQVLLEKLLVATPDATAKIAAYSGRGALEGWLRIAAVNTALKLLRKPDAQPQPDDSAAARAIAPAPDPEVDYMKRRYRAEFEDALKDAFAALAPKERNVLRLHFIDGLNIDAIGAAYGAHRATAARWLQAARQSLLDGTRKLLRERLKVSPSELESVVALVQSRLEVSLRALLATNTTP